MFGEKKKKVDLDAAGQALLDLAKKEGVPDVVMAELTNFFVEFGQAAGMTIDQTARAFAMVSVWSKENSPKGAVKTDLVALVNRSSAALRVDGDDDLN